MPKNVCSSFSSGVVYRVQYFYILDCWSNETFKEWMNWRKPACSLMIIISICRCHAMNDIQHVWRINIWSLLYNKYQAKFAHCQWTRETSCACYWKIHLLYKPIMLQCIMSKSVNNTKETKVYIIFLVFIVEAWALLPWNTMFFSLCCLSK